MLDEASGTEDSPTICLEYIIKANTGGPGPLNLTAMEYKGLITGTYVPQYACMLCTQNKLYNIMYIFSGTSTFCAVAPDFPIYLSIYLSIYIYICMYYTVIVNIFIYHTVHTHQGWAILYMKTRSILGAACYIIFITISRSVMLYSATASRRIKMATERKEDFNKQRFISATMVYVRFMKKFYPLSLYFLLSLQF